MVRVWKVFQAGGRASTKSRSEKLWNTGELKVWNTQCGGREVDRDVAGHLWGQSQRAL